AGAHVRDDVPADVAVPDLPGAPGQVDGGDLGPDGLDGTLAVEPDHQLGAGVLPVGTRGGVEPQVVGGVVGAAARIGHADLGPHVAEGGVVGPDGQPAVAGAVGVVTAGVDGRVGGGRAVGGVVVRRLGDGEATVLVDVDALGRARAPDVVLHDVTAVLDAGRAVLLADHRGGVRGGGESEDRQQDREGQ